MDLVVAVFKLGFFCLQKFFQEIIGFLFSRQFFPGGNVRKIPL